MVDLDAQAHLTTCLNQDETVAAGEEFIQRLWSTAIKISGIIKPTSLSSLKLIPASISLSALEVTPLQDASERIQAAAGIKRK